MSKIQLINFASFQVLWFVCVQGVTWAALLALSIFFSIHVIFVSRKKAELLHAVIFILLGLVVETVVNTFDIIAYAKSMDFTIANHTIAVAPLWLLCLWAGLSTTFFHSLAWLQTRPLMAGLLITLSIPLSYYAGAEFSTSTFPYSMIVALSAQTLIWLLVFPLGFALIPRLQSLLTGGRIYALSE